MTLYIALYLQNLILRGEILNFKFQNGKYLPGPPSSRMAGSNKNINILIFTEKIKKGLRMKMEIKCKGYVTLIL